MTDWLTIRRLWDYHDYSSGDKEGNAHTVIPKSSSPSLVLGLQTSVPGTAGRPSLLICVSVSSGGHSGDE